MQPGVGEGQDLAVEDHIAIKKEIEIEGPFRPAEAALAAVLSLDSLQETEESQRFERSGNLQYRIEIEPLAGRSAARLTFIEGRSNGATDRRCRAETLPRRQQVAMAVAKVGTESDVGLGREARGN